MQGPQISVRTVAKEVSDARIAFRAAVAKARKDLSDALAYGEALKQTADFIDGSIDVLPDSVPKTLQELGRATRSGVLCGAVDPSISMIIRQRATQGLAKLMSTGEKIGRVASAGKIARLSACAKVYSLCSGCEDLDDADRERAASLARHYSTHMKLAKAAHGQAHYRRT